MFLFVCLTGKQMYKVSHIYKSWYFQKHICIPLLVFNYTISDLCFLNSPAWGMFADNYLVDHYKKT